MKMKKVVLSLAGVLAAAAFAPEASAVPVFARQTGMACSACHFNHFPLLNAFGRSFKASGYTLMGAQGKVEGEDLSIPDRVNMAILATAGYEAASKDSNSSAGSNFSGWFVPTNGGELSLFMGGRISEYSGFLSELSLTAAQVKAPGGKILILPEVSNGTRAGVALYSIGQDAASSFELLNTGASSIHKLMPKPGMSNAHLQASSARQYVAPETNAAGVSLIAVNTDVGFLNISKYVSAAPGTTGTGVSGLPGTYIRAAGFFQLAGYDSAVGIQNWSGEQNVLTTQLNAATGANTVQHREEKATVVDFQMQGDLGGKGFGFYAAYGSAPNVSATATGGFNGAYVANLKTKTALTLAADYSVAPKMTINGGVRFGKIPTGGNNNAAAAQAAGAPAAGSTQTDNAVSVGFGYELAMNQHLILDYTAQSGNAWNQTTGVNSNVPGKTVATVILESLF